MYSLSVVVCMLAVAAATNVRQCPGKTPVDDIGEAVKLTPCNKLPCRLKKGTDEHIAIQFTPDKDIEQVKNSVKAKVLGLDLPFVGVDGTSVCDKLQTETGEKASCPLKAGNKYIYTDSFPIKSFYPSIDVNVRWALEENDENLICFEVPAKIV